MSKKSSPRHGSLQFWPRKRAKKEVPRVRSWPDKSDQGLLGFAGYKVGMTHVLEIDQVKNSPTKGKRVSTPVTILEVPKISLIGVRVYKNSYSGSNVYDEISNPSKDIADRLKMSYGDKSQKVVEFLNNISENISDYSFLRLLVATNPKRAGFPKKKPDVFEMALGGSIEDQLNYIKENIGNEIDISDVLSEGELVDAHAVTKGKGFEGSVKRFGISLKQHKSEKGRRGPGSIGDWKGTTFDVPMSGQDGYHLRTDYNKRILKISDDLDEINSKSGFNGYGLVKSKYLLIKGSVPGPRKRLVLLKHAIRANNKSKTNPKVISISK